MTVIAFDGITVAADRMAFKSHATTVDKLRLLPDGSVMAVTGSYQFGMRLMEWAENGFKKDDYPKAEENDGTLIVFPRDGKVRVYEGPLPWLCEESILAFGCGGPVAIGALHAGADAVRAVQICNDYAEGCGQGVQSFTLQD